MNTNNDKAPITALERAQLRRNARSVVQTAIWMGFACDSAHAEVAGNIAQEHFHLGCWLYYYSGRLHLKDNLAERIDCATRLFEAGFSDPGDNFLIVFGFGKPHFASLFRDGDKVMEALAASASAS